MKNWRFLLLVGVLVLLGVWYVLTPGTPPPNIVLLSIDTLRADRLGCYGNDMWGESPSPVLDRLAAQGILFERCFAPRGQTHPSIASMLTGKYPITHALRENGQGLHARHATIAELLKQGGYATAGFASNLPVQADPVRNPAASPPSWWTRGFDACGDGYGGNFNAETGRGVIEDQWTWDERVEQQTLQWIDGYARRGEGKPFFLWTHFYDPHKPYIPHRSCPDYYPDYEGPLEPPIDLEFGTPRDRVTELINEATRGGRPLEEKDHRKVLAMYDASLFGVDQRFGRILDALRAKGMLENTWIVFTTDHGEEMGDHNFYYYHGASIYNSVLAIPLIITGPGVAPGRRTSSLVQNVDIAASIMDLADVDPPRMTEGLSLLDIARGGEEDIGRGFAVAEWQNKIYSYSDGRHKYIFNPNGVHPRKPPYFATEGGFKYDRFELYDLEADPGETRNLWEGNRALATALRDKLLEWLRLDGHDPTGRSSIVSEGMNEAMKQLGYTGGDMKDD
jgi:arylsulfatase A-like enzyme